ncbi:trimeric intracellular cation channel family protein [Paraflavisolibacter caeni]|nr:trimeric intracellular cation channel family protein [Paraflavisolibacter caeni]
MNFIDVILYIGIFVFGLTGALKARSSSMDIFGAFVMAFATAYGGGTVRDVLIGRYPIGWMNDYLAFLLIFLATFIAFLLKRNIRKFHRIFFLTDAIGLGLFTIGGIEISLDNHINNVYAVLMGVISSTFGGLVADIISNKTPSLLKKGELYATASAIGGTVYLSLNHLLPDPNIRMIICVALIVFIRYISKWKQINLPEI